MSANVSADAAKGGLSAVELAEAHEATLRAWEKQLSALDAELAELVDYELSLRMEWQAERPLERSDSISSPVTKLRKKIDDLVGKRERLSKDVTAKRQLFEALRAEADAERQEQELREAAATIITAEVALSERWAEFVSQARGLRRTWSHVVDAATELDALPAGNVPMAPASMPADLAKALEVALVEPGQKLDAPRIVSRRIPTVSTAGTTAAVDATGAAHTIADLGDWR